jgi:patatin-like phospholipase/acyl hydrolase
MAYSWWEYSTNKRLVGDVKSSDQEFQILCLSGGGYLGLFSAIVMAEFEEKLGRPIATAFDLIAGTSVGGLLALALAFEVPAQKVVAELLKSGTKIFSDRPKPSGPASITTDLIRALFSPKYKSQPLHQALKRVLGAESILGDIPNHRIMIPAVNLTGGKAQVFKTPHLPKYERDWRQLAWQVAAATGAAPTYFPIASVGDELFADGGLYANSPDILAMHEAEYFLDMPRSSIRMLSIGTTTTVYSTGHAAGTEYGIAQWMTKARLMSTMISSQQQSVHYMMQHKLGDKYLRIDCDQSNEQQKSLSLDVATSDAQSTISAMAEATVRREINRFDEFIGHQAEPAPFYYGPKKTVDG